MNTEIRFFARFGAAFLAGFMVTQANAETMLIDHPGASGTQVFGINDRGDVVGNGFADFRLPFVFDSKKGVLTDIAPAAGFASTGVFGIDDAGNMAGSVLSLDETTDSGFILSKGGVFTFFDHPDAFSFTQARGINNKGLVSGFRDAPDGTFWGFIYDSKTGTFTDIDTGGSIFVIAHGINAKGEVVGNAFFEPDDNPCSPSFASLGWMRAADGTVTYFQVNGESTRPRGISDAGYIVGFVDHPASLSIRGFKVKPDGTQCQSISIADENLLQVMDFPLTFPEGINNSGDIVGEGRDLDGVSHGFIIKAH